MMFMAREKALYENLNKLNESSTSYYGYFWAATRDFEQIKSNISDTSGEIVEFNNHIIPEPTYFKTPEFISIW